ncbi:MAG TPA: carboxypeptidase M32 [Syntrophobacteraceae bacterium]|nr:carboxypeptidase M32 [Syntrophobacteraceae bacterium]
MGRPNIEDSIRQSESYRWLLDHSKTAALYESWKALLNWDQRTCLPKGGHSHRAQQIAAITALLYRHRTEPRCGEMLAQVEALEIPGGPLCDEAVNIREWRRYYDRAIKVPEPLAVELAKTAAESELAWQSMRHENDWKGFLPYLDRIISLKRQEAAALATGGEEIYNALIENFEPGECAENIEPLFDRLAAAAVELVRRIEASPRKPNPSVLQGDSPAPVQQSFIRQIIVQLGYDLNAGRVDRSAHPFTSKIGPGDVRITTRFDPNSFVMALFSSIHEAGHALYEQGLPVEHWGTPRGRSVSMAIHESQSRMWENMVGMSTGFWKHFYPEARRHFAWLNKIDIDKFLFALNEVSPSLIRTEADEVTYNLHIVMRFKLERMLIGGELESGELPEAWNAYMRRYFNLAPPDYSEGIMQDVHWPSGAIGYFPSYALGNMYAAQFYAKAEEDLGNLQAIFEEGEFAVLLEWLRKNIHSQGSRHLPRDLVKAATGKELNAEYLISYLMRKYEKLYGL